MNITSVGIIVKILLRSKRVSGGNEFEINQPTVLQGLENTFQLEEKLQELYKLLILNITEVGGNSSLLASNLMFNSLKTRRLSCKWSQKQTIHAKVSSVIKHVSSIPG